MPLLTLISVMVPAAPPCIRYDEDVDVNLGSKLLNFVHTIISLVDTGSSKWTCGLLDGAESI